MRGVSSFATQVAWHALANRLNLRERFILFGIASRHSSHPILKPSEQNLAQEHETAGGFHGEGLMPPPPRQSAIPRAAMTASASPREPQGPSPSPRLSPSTSARLETEPLLLSLPVDYDKALELTVGEVAVPGDELGARFSWRTLWAYAGPGWLMSIAYVDPGNLESDLQAGAYAGFQLIWVLFAATVMGFFLQVLAARLGVVTGKNLAEMCTDRYPRWASLVLWVMTEIAIVGSDIQEVLGSAIAFQILFNFPLYVGCLVGATAAWLRD